MDLDGRVAVITRGTSDIAVSLAHRFADLGSIVILSDKDEKELLKNANEIDVIPIAADISCKADIKNLVDKTIRRFNRIDLFVSTASFEASGNVCMSEKERNEYRHADTMTLMYAARYAFPQMMRQHNGYLLNIIPAEGLYNESPCEMYSTLNHPSLGFAERMLAKYRTTGIKISLVCSDFCFTPGPLPFDKMVTGTDRLRHITDRIAAGLRQEQFLIYPDLPTTRYLKVRMYNSAISVGRRA
jgi:meso-butanediol dehydrogenase / (S,S)-butanediol dehydrogenase / diacetyl reductase